jgi:hypothetical protein
MTAAVVLLAMAAVYPRIFAYPGAISFVSFSALPLIVAFGLVLNALLLVEEAGSLSSSYPRHMLTLPVRTRTLVFWPMVYSTAAGALMWIVVAVMVYRPSGFEVPVLVPALALAAVMAWVQAFAWMPMPVPWLRAIVVISSMSALAALPLRLAAAGTASTPVLALMLAGYIVAAWPLAWAAVACDRRGLAWAISPQGLRVENITSRLIRGQRPRPFESPLAAQEWYELSCHGLMMNGFVRGTLLLVWLTLFTKGRHAEGLVWFSIMIALLVAVVVVVISSAGTGLGRLTPVWSDSKGVATFVVTRPLATERFVAAKFRVAARSVLVTCVLAAWATAVWVFVSGNTENARMMFLRLVGQHSGPRGIALLALGCVLLPALCWRQVTSSVTLVLTGRRWISESAVILYMAALVCLGSVAAYIVRHPEQLGRVYWALPWAVCGLAIVKAGLAVGAFRSAVGRRLMGWRSMWRALGIWLVFSACGIAMAALLYPAAGAPGSRLYMLLGVPTFVPLCRFPCAVLALDWNRHR